MFVPYDYQESISTEAAKILDWMKLVYLCLEMRVGKTFTSFMTAEKVGAKDILFVTKLKAIGSIEKDYKTMQPPFSIKVINYEQLHNYIGNPDLVIIDEAHSCGAFAIPSERARLLKKICKDRKIIFMSGSPSPESYSQLYHQFWISSFSPFKEWPSFYKWANAGFVNIKKKYYYNREINNYSYANKEKVDQYTKHLFLTYTQDEAGFEQEVQEEIIHLRMSPKTYWLADKLTKDRVFIGKGGQEVVADTEVKLQNKLHQIYSGSVISESGEGVCFDYSKADFIREKFAGKKIAIFYIFKAEYAMLLWAFGIDKITSDPEEFNKSNNKIFISQIQAGGMGVNLSTADCLIMFNIHFSNVLYWQARARIQDKNRTKIAKLYWIFSEKGIEQRVYDCVKEKKDYVLSYFKRDFMIARREGDVTLIEKG